MEDQERKIIIDEDWKKEAQKEKELLAEKERQQQAQQPSGLKGPLQADFPGLVNMLATQALFALGLLRFKGQPQQPPDLEAARYNIDMLALLEEKTKGNLSSDEVQILIETLHQLRLAFVEVTKQIKV
ncbi:MAG: DUF1844 domain-containing protein [Sedimentisphaerales bacterium]|jgi:hypothetical protein|nr:DUF1844 domain-containing protein [Sedimentisphaerales bacterium]